MIVGVCGLIGSGKNTVADILVEEFGFRQDSFAAPLKDAVARIFGWDRDLLEGITAESRVWRESVDEWWANRLSIPHLTPRWVLQYWGTEVLRDGFHDDIWIASCENRLRQTNDNVVISDLRFPNEFKSLRSLGATTISVWRGERPVWTKYAVALNVQSLPDDDQNYFTKKLEECKIHISEWAWIGQDTTYSIQNDKSIDDLREQVRNIISAVNR